MRRSLFGKLPALCAALLLAACAAGGPASTAAPAGESAPAQTAETPAPTETPAATPAPTLAPAAAGPLYWVDAQNDAGRYEAEWDYNTDTVVARYLDFDTATEQIVGEPLELPNINADLFADDEYLYWFWSGMVSDTPILLRSNLDGSERAPLYEFPQGTSLAVWNSGFASDGGSLYFRYCQISDDPAVPDVYSLARLAPEAQTLETLTTWSPFGGELVGVWNDRLLITRRTLAEDCPVAPVYGHYHVDNLNDLSDWMTTSLCALDPATGEEEVLYECSGSWLDRQLEDGALWRVNERHEILYRPLGENEDTMLTQLPQGMQFLNVYTTDVTFNSYEGERDWLYLYDRTTGSLTRSPQRRWMGGEDRAIWVICEAGPGRYVVIDDASAGMQAMADADGNQYLIDGYARYAIASRDALLDGSIPLTPVTRPGTV